MGLVADLMAVRIPLPTHDSLPGSVYFHREHPADKRLVLQIPNADKTGSETHIIDMLDHKHKLWMDGLKQSGRLTAILSYATHVAYDMRTGYCVEMLDLDAPTPGEKLLKGAHKHNSKETLIGQWAIRRQKRSSVAPPLMSALKRSRR